MEIEARWGWSDNAQRDNFLREWNDHAFISVISEDRVVGYVQQSIESDHVYLHSIGFLKNFRRQGLGRQLMNSIMDEAKSIGKEVRLSVSPLNSSAVRMYTELGFEITSSSEATLNMKK